MNAQKLTIHFDNLEVGPGFIDLHAEKDTQVQVEVQPEIGQKDRYKLYVHVDGRTLFRIGNLKLPQIEMKTEGIKLMWKE